MEPLTLSVLAIVGVFIILAVVVARVDGLTFLGPRSTRAMQKSATVFCSNSCRVEGRCPLSGTAEAAEACPLWKYIGADFPTAMYGSPFESLHT